MDRTLEMLRPYQERLTEQQELIAELRASLKWAMGHVGSYKTRIKGQNENFCDRHDKAMSLLAEGK
jgi:hypothetical protein